MSNAPYVHDLDPVIWQISDSIALRWYGLAYLMGFVVGYLLLKYLSGKKLYPVPQHKLADFITYVAIFGVLIGGRLGYVLFYQIPNHGWSAFMADPLMLFRVWEGGMASHGGIIGVALYTLYYARKHRIQWLALLDGMAIVAPVGLFFGRMANFINGELYGRIAPAGSSHAMIFPAELYQDPTLITQTMVRINTPEILEKIVLAGHQIPDTLSTAWVIERVRDTPAVKEVVAEVMQGHARYPSQLYEAFAEGVLLFGILWAVRLLCPKAYNGIFCGIFAFVYAAGRILCEAYSEPDSPLSMGLTRGQFLSLFLVIFGVVCFMTAWRKKKTVADCVYCDPAAEKERD